MTVILLDMYGMIFPQDVKNFFQLLEDLQSFIIKYFVHVL